MHSTNRFYSPTKIALSVAVRGVTIGSYFTCSIVQNGNVYCWGYGGDGALGVQVRCDQTMPTIPVELPWWDIIRCEPTTDECHTDGWTLAVDGTLVDVGSELAGHPIIVPDSICRRIEPPSAKFNRTNRPFD